MTLIGAFFLLYLSIVLPVLTLRSARLASMNTAMEPSRTGAYLSTIFTLAVTLFLALTAARSAGIQLFPFAKPGTRDLLIGAAALAFLLVVFVAGLRQGAVSPMTWWLAPKTSGQLLVFTGMSAIAAIAEESAYRGTAFQLFSHWMGNAAAGALASAIVFGFAHATQGKRAIVVTIAYGLLEQLVVYLTGSLYVIMAVHFLYDVIAGLTLSFSPSRRAA